MSTEIISRTACSQQLFQSKTLCRICLSKSDQMLALHEELGPHTSISVLTALQSVMAVKLNESKAYPQLICSICLSSLRIAYDLQQQYHESDKRITCLLNKAMEELPAIIKVENERVTSGDTVVELTEGQTKYLDLNIILKEEISHLSENLEIMENIEVPDYVSAEDISTLCHDIKTETEECDLSQIKMETEESNSTSTSSEQTKHVTNNTLEDDLCVEQPEQFTCASCNKSFPFKYRLRRHMLTCTGKKAYSCQYCELVTTQASNLKRHMLKHLEEKPHTCQYCPYKSRTSSHLRDHMLTHTGEKPHACQYCPYKARQRNTLNKHMLRHTRKLHACQYCPYSTMNEGHFQGHMLTHTGENQGNIE